MKIIAGATSPTRIRGNFLRAPNACQLPMTQDQQPTSKQDTAHPALRSACVVFLCAQALIYRIRASVVIYPGISVIRVHK